MGNGVMAKGPKLPRPSSTLPCATCWRRHAYDDWDHICEAIYRSIVIGSIENADGLGDFMPIVDYDRRTNTYETNSFIGNASPEGEAAFVCFETERSPFDRCLFAVLDRHLNVIGERRTATAETQFLFLCRPRDRQDYTPFEKIAVSI
jgi:hypothetical protein